jgi:hypothetical protein
LAGIVVPVFGAMPAGAAPKAPRAKAAAGRISTFAGGGIGDGSPAVNAVLMGASDAITDAAGNIYIADGGGNRVRKVDTHGVITTIAGTGANVFSGDGGPATKAGLTPVALAFDKAGDLLIADSRSLRVRRVSPSGVISTFAGDGQYGDGGDGGPATSAQVVPASLAVDSVGDVFIGDYFGTVRMVNAAGVISTFAGGGSPADGVGDGGPATAAALGAPVALAFDRAGDLFIADQGAARVRKVDAFGVISTVAGTGQFATSADGVAATQAAIVPLGVAVDAAGDLLLSDPSGPRVRRVVPGPDGVIDGGSDEIISEFAGAPPGGASSGDGGPATAAQFQDVGPVWLDGAGNALITDSVNDMFSRIRRVAAATGIITTVAGGGIGDGDPATAARLQEPYGVAVAGATTYISELLSDRVRKVSAGRIATIAGGGTTHLGNGGPATAATMSSPVGVAFDAAGNLYISDQRANTVRKVDPSGRITALAGSGSPTFSGDGGPALTAGLSVSGIAADAQGDVFIADGGNNRIRKVDTAGTITTVAGGGTPATGVGDGGPATQASLTNPNAVAVDARGDLFIADSSDNRIRRVDAATRRITTVAGTGVAGSTGDGGRATRAQIGYPLAVAVDPAGDVYFSDLSASTIRRVDTAGIITTVAGGGTPATGVGDGGPATSASLARPEGLAFDPSGNLLIGDANESRVRKVTAGVITTIGGNGTHGFGGDGGPATSAELSYPAGIAYDHAGNLYIADSSNSRVRKIDPSGIITTVAGGGVGDGLPATSIGLSGPEGLSTDASGDVYIAECGTSRVRKVGADGVITTVAGGGAPFDQLGDGRPATGALLSCPAGVSVVAPHAGTAGPAGGSLLIADCGANRIRLVDPTGKISTIAGTGTAGYNGDNRPASQAQLSCPSDAKVDAAGNVYVADMGNNRVRKVDPSGIITTVAGDGNTGYGADGPATAAHVNGPTGLAVDGVRGLYIAENRHSRIRRVDLAHHTIATVAGTGVPGLSGDGGPATQATLGNPTQIAVDDAGNVLFTDGFAPADLTRGNDRVAEIRTGTPEVRDAGCGQVITSDTKLTRDLGPCPGDGIIVGADNITLDLNGHTVKGAGPGDGSHPGVRISQHQGVTVTGGTITGFAAGVAIIGGSGNNLTNLTVTGNIGPPQNLTPEFGDGVAIFFAPNNRIQNDTISGNGTSDGVALLGLGANYNLVEDDLIENNAGPGILVNAFLDFNLPGRGGSLNNNDAIGNTLINNAGDGISNVSNDNATDAHNTLTNNGQHPGPFDSGNGIGMQAGQIANHNTADLVEYNVITGSGFDGIQTDDTSGNQILDNVVTGSNAGGTYGFDLHDFFGDCNSNTWSGNDWGTAGLYPACTGNGGHQVTSAAAPAATRPTGGGKAAPPATPGPSRHLSAPDAAVAPRS